MTAVVDQLAALLDDNSDHSHYVWRTGAAAVQEWRAHLCWTPRDKGAK